MNLVLITLAILLAFWLFYKLFSGSGGNEYNRDANHYNRHSSDYNKQEGGELPKQKKSFFSFLFAKRDGERPAKRQNIFKRLFSTRIPFDDEAVTWCANFLIVDKKVLVDILKNRLFQYDHFKLRKRSGGYRTISVPNRALMAMQKTIYQRILSTANVHPMATGFRPNISVLHNAKVHLGKNQILKIDIADFFGSISKAKVIAAFEKLGYPANVSKVLAAVCVLNDKLPQGAPTSPALSNFIFYQLDVKLAALCQQYEMTYTRYADDLTFSGENVPVETLLPIINRMLLNENFVIQRKKTRLLVNPKRKIITGISVSSGEKLTVPRAKKREIRKNVHFILTKGLEEHQKFIGSNDPSYLRRIIGYLNFWQMVEPDNEYVKKSLIALKQVKK